MHITSCASWRNRSCIVPCGAALLLGKQFGESGGGLTCTWPAVTKTLWDHPGKQSFKPTRWMLLSQSYPIGPFMSRPRREFPQEVSTREGTFTATIEMHHSAQIVQGHWRTFQNLRQDPILRTTKRCFNWISQWKPHGDRLQGLHPRQSYIWASVW